MLLYAILIKGCDINLDGCLQVANGLNHRVIKANKEAVYANQLLAFALHKLHFRTLIEKV